MVFKLATTPLLSRNINVLLSTTVAAKVPTAFTALPWKIAATTILKNGFNNFAASKRLYATTPNKTYYNKGVREADINVVASIKTNDSSNILSLNSKSTVTTTVNPGTLKAYCLLRSPAKVMNTGRWSPQERSSIIDMFLSLNKKLDELDMYNYIAFSDHVSTRSPSQCYSYLRYHCK